MWEFITVVTLIVISEGMGVYYSYFIKYIIAFLYDPEAEVKDGVKLVAIFFAL
jgi:hypothetical protein